MWKSAYIETTEKNERPELIEKNECARKCEKYDIKCICTLRQWMFSLFRYIHSVFAFNGNQNWLDLYCEMFARMHTCTYVHLSSLFFSLFLSHYSLSFECDHAGAYNFYLFHKLPKCGAQAWTLFMKWFRCRRGGKTLKLETEFSTAICELKLRNPNFMLGIRQKNKHTINSAMSLSSQHDCLHQNEFLICYAFQINKLNWVQSTNE